MLRTRCIEKKKKIAVKIKPIGKKPTEKNRYERSLILQLFIKDKLLRYDFAVQAQLKGLYHQISFLLPSYFGLKKQYSFWIINGIKSHLLKHNYLFKEIKKGTEFASRIRREI